MKKSSIKTSLFGLSALALLAIQGCAAGTVADAAVSTTAFAGKTVVRGTVGASKLLYSGGKAVLSTGRGGYSDQPYAGGPSGDTAPSCLEANGSYSSALEDQNGEYYCPG